MERIYTVVIPIRTDQFNFQELLKIISQITYPNIVDFRSSSLVISSYTDFTNKAPAGISCNGEYSFLLLRTKPTDHEYQYKLGFLLNEEEKAVFPLIISINDIIYKSCFVGYKLPHSYKSPKIFSCFFQII